MGSRNAKDYDLADLDLLIFNKTGDNRDIFHRYIKLEKYLRGMCVYKNASGYIYKCPGN